MTDHKALKRASEREAVAQTLERKGTEMHYAAHSTAGMLLSLANTLPPKSSPLRRQAAHVARQLNRPHPRALDRKASDLLALLLDATDTPESAEYDVDGLLSADFDTL